MSTASTRTEKRAPVTLKIKFKSSTLDQFVERYSVDISQGGIFIRTKSPLEVGTPLRFEFQLKNAQPLITGEGTVVWTREYDPSRTGLAPGMGVRFDRLPAESQQMLAKILEQKKARPAPRPTPAKSSPMPASGGDDPSDEFTDSPTRVAPRDVIAGLADTSRDFDNTDVPADAFEEATKVGLLDELVARTAETDDDEPILTSAPRERAPSSQPVGVATARDDEDDDEPELPAPVGARAPSIDDELEPVPPNSFDDEIVDLPAPAARKEDFLDHIPTELNLAPPPPSKSAADHAPTERALAAPTDEDVAAAKGKLGAPSETLLDSVPPLPDRPPVVEEAPQPVDRQRSGGASAPPSASKPLASTPHLLASSDSSESEASSGGGSGLWIAMAVGIILLAGGGGAWWMMNRDDDTSATKPPPKTQPQTQPAKQPPPEAPDAAPQPVGLEATVASKVDGATATLVGADQSGPTPMTFTGLEEGKTYKVSVAAPGFMPAEIEIKGGETPEPVALEAKPRFLSVKSTPAGAAIYINRKRQTGKTPAEIEIKGALAKAETLDVELRRAGYNVAKKTFAASDTWSEEDARMIATLELTLDRRAPRTPPTNNTTNNNTTNNTNGGDGAGSGTGTGAGSGTGTTDSGGGEPVPDWAKDKNKKPPEGGTTKPPADSAPKTDPAPAPQ